MHQKLIFICCVLLILTNAVKAQAPRFIFLDSLSYQLSPVSPEVIRNQGFTRTEMLITNGIKKQDTVQVVTFNYNRNGNTVSSTSKRRKGDTIFTSYVYDNLNRVIQKRGTRGGKPFFTTESKYIDDTVIHWVELDARSRPTKAARLHFNEHKMLTKYVSYDTAGNVTESTSYSYTIDLLPKRVVQSNVHGIKFDNRYEHSFKKGSRTVEVYETFGGDKRLVEKMYYNSKGQLVKTISYDYYYKSKDFIGELEYYNDGSLKTYKGYYPYSGYKFYNHYVHYR